MQQLPPALAALAGYRQFIAYRLQPSTRRPGKMDKFPLDVRTGRGASTVDPTTWATVDEVLGWLSGRGADYGLGFVFTSADPFFFIDIDGALANGEWTAVAQQLCQVFNGAAVEVSSSGTGLHIIGSGLCPEHSCRNAAYGLELYTAERFVALTGISAQGDARADCSATLPWLVSSYFPPSKATDRAELDDGPCEEWRGPTDDAELIRRALRSSSGASTFSGKASFADLWDANAEALARTYPDGAGGYDASAADRALAQHLAFWTGRDAARIERLMWQSKLVRDKWSERADYYLPRTIGGACQSQVDVLQDKPAAPTPVAEAAAVVSAAPAPVALDGNRFVGQLEQIEYFKGCVYIQDQNGVLIPGGRVIDSARFKATYGGAAFVMDQGNERTTRNAFEAFTESQVWRNPRADTTCFKPDRLPGEIINEGGRTMANTWWPVEIERAKGDASPFVNHVAKLLPDERDRRIVLSYMAALVQYKGVKFQWAILLQGCEGNGKTLLSRCVAQAIGRRYTHWPKAKKLTAQFNKWMLGNILIAVEDIEVPDHSIDVMSELKPMITGGDGLEIEGKGIDQISADVCCNFMLNTNRKDGLRTHRNDRRFAIFYTAQQDGRRDLARDGMTGDYFPNLYRWLRNGGYAIVNDFLLTYQIDEEFNPAGECQRAPRTSSTDEAIAHSLGSVEQDILEAIEQERQGFKGGWISSMKLDELLLQAGRRHISQMRRREILGTLGYIPHPTLPGGRVTSIVMPDGGRPRLYVLQGHTALSVSDPLAVARMYSAANSY